MKTLVVYYSRSGHNEKLSQELAEALGADLEKVVDTKNRAGALGWIIGGKDASLKKLTTIEPVQKNPADYDLVIFASPLWVGMVAPAIREYVTSNKDKLKKIAFASVCGGGKPQSSIEDLENISGKKLFSTLYFSDTEFKGDYHQKIDQFIDTINL